MQLHPNDALGLFYHNSTPTWRVKRISGHFLFLAVMYVKR